MKVILFGATGMIGQGVLRECLLDPDVNLVLTVSRTPLGQHHAKLREIITADLANVSTYEKELAGFDACFFCLGVSSAGMSEENYRRTTYELTIAEAETFLRRNPDMVFIYVSGAGTDSSERGRSMWARIKGQTENALLRLPFKTAYMFRIGAVQPLHGIKSKTKLCNVLYVYAAPLISVLRRIFPQYVTTTEQVGLAMLRVAKHGAPKAVLESADISRF